MAIEPTYPIKAVAFDFDYTLADSSKGAVDCINFALREMGLPAVSAEVARRTIGLSLPDTFLELIGPEHAVRSDEFTRLFIQRANEVMTDLTVLFEEVPRTVEHLRRQELGLGIVSTKFRRRIEAVLRREGLLDAFDVIVGGEDVSAHKPDPEGLLKVIEGLGSSPPRSLYVGDSVTDAETAKRAALPFVAVLSGVTRRGSFSEYPVSKVLERLSELPGLVR